MDPKCMKNGGKKYIRAKSNIWAILGHEIEETFLMIFQHCVLNQSLDYCVCIFRTINVSHVPQRTETETETLTCWDHGGSLLFDCHRFKSSL